MNKAAPGTACRDDQLAALAAGHHRNAGEPALVNALVEGADEHVRPRVVACYARLDLFLLDEVGHVQIDYRGTELLLQIIAEREERQVYAWPAICASASGDRCSPIPGSLVAIVDRAAVNAQILETGAQSNWLRTSKTAAGRRRSWEMPLSGQRGKCGDPDGFGGQQGNDRDPVSVILLHGGDLSDFGGGVTTEQW